MSHSYIQMFGWWRKGFTKAKMARAMNVIMWSWLGYTSVGVGCAEGTWMLGGLSLFPGPPCPPWCCPRVPCTVPSTSGHSLLAGAPGLDCLELTIEGPPAACHRWPLNSPHLRWASFRGWATVTMHKSLKREGKGTDISRESAFFWALYRFVILVPHFTDK